ncbi:MAG: 5-deoxy-glucuronate isomerase [Thermomicrobiales bacterium]
MKNASDLLLHSSRIDLSGSELIAVTPESAGWDFCSLTVHRLTSGQRWNGETTGNEVVVLPLGGRCQVTSDGDIWSLGERRSVFDGQPWALYLPIGSAFEVVAETDLEIAVCGARADQRFPPRLIRPHDVDVEIRGAGNACRQINHIIRPDFPAQRLLVVEVFTPSGNWSSYPPHKHDVSNLPVEADLEEIYYYRIEPDDGFGLQRLYTADLTIDQAYVIHDGDLLLVLEGYHAFAVAQGYTGYYLNVLAGNETIRTMQPSDDPRYAWVRGTWTPELVDGLISWRDIEEKVNHGAGGGTIA